MHKLKPMPYADYDLIKDSFKERYQCLLGDCYEKFIKYSFSYARKSIRVNTLKISVPELVKRLEDRWNLEAIPWCEGGFWISFKGDEHQEERFDIGNLPEHALGYFYVQDAASMIPPVVLKPQPGDKVLDMCAAPGSKTSQMAMMMENEGLIVANDLQATRLRPLAVNLQRAGVKNTVMTQMPGQVFAQRNILFDKVLVDAPCTGTGTIRRSMKVLKMWSPGLVERITRDQRKLIKAGFEILKPGGLMVYSTCSQEPAENEGMVSWLLENYPNAEVVPIELDIKRSEALTSFDGVEFDPRVKDTLRIYPYDNDTEGFYVSLIRKNPGTKNE